MMRKILFFFTGLLLTAGFVHGQDASGPNQAEQIKTLLARVELLEKEVAELKANRAASMEPAPLAQPAAPSPRTPEETPAKIAAQMHEHEGQIPQEALQQLETHYPSLQIRGFADADFS